jgi:hypothetical protein
MVIEEKQKENPQNAPLEEIPISEEAHELKKERNAGFAWKAKEYEIRDKGNAWFGGLGILALFMLVFSIWTKAWTMTVLVVLLAVVYVIAHRREPVEMQIEISELGVKFGQKTFPYEQLKTFWISRLENTVTVNTKGKIMPQMEIHLMDQDPREIKTFLASRITEVAEPDPSILDNLYRTLGI